MAASDARPVPRKNIAWRMPLAIRKNDGTLITTWAGADTEISLDGAAFNDCTNEITEIGTTGCGYIDFTAAEMNADSVIIKSTVTNSGALTLIVTVFPEESGDYRADMTLISGDSVAADNAESFFDGTGYAGTNNVIPRCTLVDTLTTYTGNTLQTGDSFARLGAAGAGLTALGDTRVANLDATVSSRMATYTQPSGFLAATFPSDPADQSLIIDATSALLTAVNLRATQTSVDTIDDFLDTEIAAIKTKTDQLTFTVANQVDANAVSGGSGTESDLLQSTTIATLTSQTIFTLTAGSADDNAYVDCLVVILDAVTAVQKAVGVVYSYTGATKSVRLTAAPAFTIATGDTVKIIAHGNTAATLASVTVTPVLGVVTERVSETNITTYVGEDYVATITTLDSAGAAVDPSTWSTLQIVIEDRRGTDLLTIANASITTTSTTIAFTIPAATVNIEPAVHKWALRSISGNIVRLEGNINVKYAADD